MRFLSMTLLDSYMLKYSYTYRLNVKSDYASLTYHFPQIMIVILIICTRLFVGLILLGLLKICISILYV